MAKRHFACMDAIISSTEDNSKLLFDSTTVCGYFNKILLPMFIKFLQVQGTNFDGVCFSSLQYCTMTGMITCRLTGMTRMTRITGIIWVTRMTGMTGMTRMTGIIGTTRMTGDNWDEWNDWDD